MLCRKRIVRKISAAIAILLAIILVFVGCVTVKENNDLYFSSQDQMATDLGCENAFYLKKMMLEAQNKSKYDKADIYAIALNRVLNEKYPKNSKPAIAEEDNENTDDVDPESNSYNTESII